MPIAYRRAASSFISLHAALDLPAISIGIDVDVPPLASLLDIGHTGEVTPVLNTSTVIQTSSNGDFTSVTSKTTVAPGTPTLSTQVSPTGGGGGNNNEHDGGGASATGLSNNNNPSFIPEGTGTNNDITGTFTSDTTSRSKQDATRSGHATDILLVAASVSSGSVTTTITMPTNTSDVTPLATTASSLEAFPNPTSHSLASVTSTTLTGALTNPSNRTAAPTSTPPGGSSKRHLSPGAIAGIVIALILFFLGIFMVIYRKRRAYRRDQVALGWSRSRSLCQDEPSPQPEDIFRRFTVPFTTNKPNSFDEVTPILSPPPMAEYARSTRSSRSTASSLPHSFSEANFHDCGHRPSGSDGSPPSLLIDSQEITLYDTAPSSAPPFASKTFVLSNPPIPTIRISPASAPPSKSIFIPSYRPITVDLPPIPPLPSSPPPKPPIHSLHARDPFEDPPG